MSLLAIVLAVGVVGFALGNFIGVKGAGWLAAATLAIWIAGFFLATATSSEPATTVLGWGFVVALPCSGVLVAAAGLGEWVGGLRRSRPVPSVLALPPEAILLAPAEAVLEAFKQFSAGIPISVFCQKCRGGLTASVHKPSSTTVVACPCNACRRDFTVPDES